MNKSKDWINAAIAIWENPKQEILCPECKKGILQKLEVDEKGVCEKYLVCPNCNSRNVITMFKK